MVCTSYILNKYYHFFIFLQTMAWVEMVAARFVIAKRCSYGVRKLTPYIRAHFFEFGIVWFTIQKQ